MIWLWPVTTIILFYFFALLQNSFFVYFSFFGTAPNLVFILFFLLVFFSKKNSYYKTLFVAVLAGLFLDVFSVSQIGISIILLIIIGFSIVKIQSLLKEKEENYPFTYFLALFSVSFIIYYLLEKICIYFLSPGVATIGLSLKFLAEMAYSLFFAVLGFFVYKGFISKDTRSRLIK